MSTTPPESLAFRPRLGRHLKDLTRLAVPMILARSGQTIMITVDTRMVGRYSAGDLAYLGLANAVLFTVMIGAIGLLIGTVASTSRAYGAGDADLCGEVFRRGVRYAFVLGVAARVLMAWPEPLFSLTAGSAEMVAGAASATRIFALGLPGATLFMMAAFFLVGIKRPRPAMVLMVGANLLNILLNWLLVYGHWGLPALGADGSALASSILRWAMAGALLAYILWLMPGRSAFALRRPRPGSWRRATRERRLGYANGVSQLAEAAAFSAMTLYASAISVIAVGVYTISLNLLGMLFMVALGTGFATAVRVGYAIGHGDGDETAFAGWTGLAANTVVCLLLAALVVT
ncbi:MAG: MATE family efflux transporter, partial [Alphaproteobacteria bacterium]